MTNDKFEELFDRRIQMCREVMVTKAKEYADVTDRLANFKKAGALQHEHPAKALQGMMAKHQVSIADMAKGLDEGKSYSQVQWDEKIGDALNYLFLLDALVQESSKEPIGGEHPTEALCEDVVTVKRASATHIAMPFGAFEPATGIWQHNPYLTTPEADQRACMVSSGQICAMCGRAVAQCICTSHKEEVRHPVIDFCMLAGVL